MKGFIIYALPRSRTAWLAHFLTYGDWTCCHDVVTDVHSFAELQEIFGIPYIGSAETGMIEGWKAMEKIAPDHRRVVIRRPLEEIKASLAKFGLADDEGLERREKMLIELSAQPDVMTVNYADLDNIETIKALFEFCLLQPFDEQYWERLRHKNIQIDMPARIWKLQKNQPGINALKTELMNFMRQQ